MFALDTNTLIYFFRGEGNVAAKLLSTPPSDLGVPSIVLFELEVGLARAKSRRRRGQQLNLLANSVHLLPFDAAAARSAAQIRVALAKAGTPIGPYDVLIAGTALANNATLVTHNTREFSRVASLRLTDWY